MQASMERYAAALMNNNIRKPKISRRNQRTRQVNLDSPECHIEPKRRRVPEAPIIDDHDGDPTLDPDEPIVDREDPKVKPTVLRTP